MQAQVELMTRDQVLKHIWELAKHLLLEKLASWYEYGLFIQTRPIITPAIEVELEDDEQAMLDEFAQWEAASDEDWLKFEQQMQEVA